MNSMKKLRFGRYRATVVVGLLLVSCEKSESSPPTEPDSVEVDLQQAAVDLALAFAPTIDELSRDEGVTNHQTGEFERDGFRWSMEVEQPQIDQQTVISFGHAIRSSEAFQRGGAQGAGTALMVQLASRLQNDLLAGIRRVRLTVQWDESEGTGELVIPQYFVFVPDERFEGVDLVDIEVEQSVRSEAELIAYYNARSGLNFCLAVLTAQQAAWNGDGIIGQAARRANYQIWPFSEFASTALLENQLRLGEFVSQLGESNSSDTGQIEGLIRPGPITALAGDESGFRPNSATAETFSQFLCQNLAQPDCESASVAGQLHTLALALEGWQLTLQDLNALFERYVELPAEARGRLAPGIAAGQVTPFRTANDIGALIAAFRSDRELLEQYAERANPDNRQALLGANDLAWPISVEFSGAFADQVVHAEPGYSIAASGEFEDATVDLVASVELALVPQPPSAASAVDYNRQPEPGITRLGVREFEITAELLATIRGDLDLLGLTFEIEGYEYRVVTSRSPGSRLGIRARDVLVQIGSAPVLPETGLNPLFERLAAEGSAELTVDRRGRRRVLSYTVADEGRDERPDAPYEVHTIGATTYWISTDSLPELLESYDPTDSEIVVGDGTGELVVTRISPGAVISSLGIRQGDALLRIGDNPVTLEAGLAPLFDALSASGHSLLTIRRNGGELVHSYSSSDRLRDAIRAPSLLDGGEGWLRVFSTPLGAVYINGDLTSHRTVTERIPLPAGSHSVSVFYDELEVMSEVQQVTIREGGQTSTFFRPRDEE